MRRRAFRVAAPVRYIRDEDGIREFDSELLKSCRTSMSDLCRMNRGNVHVLVYDLDPDPDLASVIVFKDNGDEVHIEAVSNNFALPRSVLREIRPGGFLYEALEEAAREHGVRRITLKSVPDRIEYWRGHGFAESGAKTEGAFCMLQPMEKAL